MSDLGLWYGNEEKDLGLQGPYISMYDAGWFSVLENNQLCSVTTTIY
jgi:hypothetical protein